MGDDLVLPRVLLVRDREWPGSRVAGSWAPEWPSLVQKAPFQVGG